MPGNRRAWMRRGPASDPAARRARPRAAALAENCTSLPCSSRVYQLPLIPASCASSSRRSPGVRRRLTPWGSPTFSGRSAARRARRNAPSSWRCSSAGMACLRGGRRLSLAVFLLGEPSSPSRYARTLTSRLAWGAPEGAAVQGRLEGDGSSWSRLLLAYPARWDRLVAVHQPAPRWNIWCSLHSDRSGLSGRGRRVSRA
jgi:hypothetical protein